MITHDFSVLTSMLPCADQWLNNAKPFITNLRRGLFSSVSVYHEKVDWMYYVAFGAVAVRLVIYSGDSNNDDRRGQVAEAGDLEAKLSNEEGAVDQQCHGAASSGSRKFEDGKGPYHALGNDEREVRTELRVSREYLGIVG